MTLLHTLILHPHYLRFKTALPLHDTASCLSPPRVFELVNADTAFASVEPPLPPTLPFQITLLRLLDVGHQIVINVTSSLYHKLWTHSKVCQSVLLTLIVWANLPLGSI